MSAVLEEPRREVEVRLPDAFRTFNVVNPARDLNQLANLIEEVRDYDTTKPLVYLEVGTWCGCSAYAASSLPNVRVFCVDHWGGTPGDTTWKTAKEHGAGTIYRAFCHNMGNRLYSTVFPVHGFSIDVSRRWKLPLDVVFIDAAHDLNSVLQDYNAWRQHVKPGGRVIGHDAWMFGVKRALKRIDGVNVEKNIWWVDIT